MRLFRKILLAIVILFLITHPSNGFSEAENTIRTPKASLVRRRGNAAVAGSSDSIALSMMLWGTGMAVAIAALSALIKTSDGGGSGGSSAHSHS